jgi:hypothetical protein
MTLLHYDRYGGRKGRYKPGFPRILELFDPWECRTHQFRDEWSQDLWLLRRSDLTVKSIKVHPKPLEYLSRGIRRRGVADLAIEVPGGMVYEALDRAPDASDADRHAELHRAAELHGVRSSVVPLAELRGRSNLIQNMERVRQVLVMWLDRDLSAVQDGVLGALKRGALARAALRVEVSGQAGEDAVQGLDAAIFRLHFSRQVRVDLDGRYDDDSVIHWI